MIFGKYLKMCREKHHFTQKDLAEKLYHFHPSFNGVDEKTVSRWERSVTKPVVLRIINIIEFFHSIHPRQVILPCYEEDSYETIKSKICHAGIADLMGKNRELVLNFPTKNIENDQLKILHLRESDSITQAIDLAMVLDKTFTNHYSQLTDKHFKSWAKFPTSFFLIAVYKEQFLGLLFILRLKPDIFDKIMKFEMKEKDLNISHFAAYNEECCGYILNFFASSQDIANSFYTDYYAHLIINQNTIREVGALTMMDDGKQLLERMNLTFYKDVMRDEHKLLSYRASLKSILINKNVLNMLFQKEECVED